MNVIHGSRLTQEQRREKHAGRSHSPNLLHNAESLQGWKVGFNKTDGLQITDSHSTIPIHQTNMKKTFMNSFVVRKCATVGM